MNLHVDLDHNVSPHYPGRTNFGVERPDQVPTIENTMSSMQYLNRGRIPMDEYSADVQPQLQPPFIAQSHQSAASYTVPFTAAPPAVTSTTTYTVPFTAPSQAAYTQPTYTPAPFGQVPSTYVPTLNTHYGAQTSLHSAQHQGWQPPPLQLRIRQQPLEGVLVVKNKEKGRKPIDPPPIVELFSPVPNADQNFLQNPYYFMTCKLIPEDLSHGSNIHGRHGTTTPARYSIMGAAVSTIHRFKDINNKGESTWDPYWEQLSSSNQHLRKDGGFFVFADMSVEYAGDHKRMRLKFSLFEMRKEHGITKYLDEIISEPFDIISNKDWKGLKESTYLSRAFSDQGCRIRLRKEPRSQSKSTKRSHDEAENEDFAQPVQQPQRHVKREVRQENISFDGMAYPAKRQKRTLEDEYSLTNDDAYRDEESYPVKRSKRSLEDPYTFNADPYRNESSQYDPVAVAVASYANLDGLASTASMAVGVPQFGMYANEYHNNL